MLGELFDIIWTIFAHVTYPNCHALSSLTLSHQPFSQAITTSHELGQEYPYGHNESMFI